MAVIAGAAAQVYARLRIRAATALRAPAEIWLNESAAANHWLELKLTGTISNRDAIGAVVKVTSPRGVQYNHVTTAVGYASSSAGPVHFGLGRDARIERIEIRWPSGTLQTIDDVRCDRVLTIQEPGKR